MNIAENYFLENLIRSREMVCKVIVCDVIIYITLSYNYVFYKFIICDYKNLKKVIYNNL